MQVKRVTQRVPVPKREMHRQTVAADQASMVSDIGQVLEQRRPFRQDIDDQALYLQAAASVPRSKPISSSARPGRHRLLWQHRLITLFRSVQAANMAHRQNGSPAIKDQLLICLPVEQL